MSLVRSLGLLASFGLLLSPFASASEISRWTLDGSLGDSVGSNSGSFNGGTSPLWVEGADGSRRSALELDGRGEFVTFPAGAGLPVSTLPAYSIAFRVRALPQEGRAVYAESSSSDPNPRFVIGTAPESRTGQLTVRIEDRRGAAIVDHAATDAVVLDGSWHHVVWVDNSGAARLYVDGALDREVPYTPSGAGVPALDRIALGAEAGSRACCWWDGTLDDVRVFDHALSAIEVEALERNLPKPEILSVAPRYVDTRGGDEIVVQGTDFTDGMTLLILTREGSEVELDFDRISSRELTAVMPPREAGPASLGVRLGDGSPLHVAEDALEFVSPSVPAPREIETSLVDGVARIDWVNPEPFDQILVYRGDVLQATLPGDATMFIDPEPVTGLEMDYSLVGTSRGRGTGLSRFVLARLNCFPVASFTPAQPGPRIFRVRGGHEPLLPAGAGGGGDAGDLEPVLADGEYRFVEIDPLTKIAAINYDTDGLRRREAPNELVTGFRLEQVTKKVRILVHGAKIDGSGEPSLRVRIDPASPDIEREPVELTFPPLPLDPDHRWLEIDYNTDFPPPPGKSEAGPDDERPPPDEPMPPGGYLLTIYSVAGFSGRAHFEISSADSLEQIPVPGAGCPPYPLVRVEPTYNFNPEIHDIEQIGEVTEFGQGYYTEDGEYLPLPLLLATVEADVTDLDLDPIVRYRFEVDTGQGTPSFFDSASDKFTAVFVGYGTFPVTLEVRDNRCGKEKETFPVTIRPPCIPRADGPNFTYPTPRPDSLYMATELGLLDRLQGQLPGTFRFFVVDPEGCDAWATTRGVQAGLFPAGGPANPAGAGSDAIRLAPAYILGINEQNETCSVVQITGENRGENPGEGTGTGLDENFLPCTFDLAGGRVWTTTLDLSSLPPVLGDGSGTFELWARGSDASDGSSGWSTWRRIQTYIKVTEPLESYVAVPGSQSLNVTDLPDLFREAPYSAGEYEPSTREWDFQVSMAPPNTGTGVFPSDEVAIEDDRLEDIEGRLPSSDNGLISAEQTTFLQLQQGAWKLERVRRGYEALALGQLHYDRTDISGSQLQGGGASTLEESICDALSYEECRSVELEDRSFEIPLFNAPIFVDPVTGGIIFKMSIASSIGGFFKAAVGTRVAAEACPPEGEPAFEALFWFLTAGGMYFSSEIDMDYLLGIVSTDFGIDLGISGKLPVLIDAVNLGSPQFGFLLESYIDVWFEVCGLWVFCREERAEVYRGTILNVNDADAALSAVTVASTGCPDGGGGSEPVMGQGGAEVAINAPSRQLSIADSPDGFRQIAVGRGDDGQLFYLLRRAQGEWKWPPRPVLLPGAQADEYAGPQSDPEVVFIDSDTVLLAWTQSFANEDPELEGITEDDLADTEIFNRVARRTEIVITTGTWQITPLPPDDPGSDLIIWDTAERLSGDPGPEGHRADGRVSLALDPSSINGPLGTGVWAAWVRYETPDMVQLDGEGEPRVQMKQTSIYTRRIFPGGLLSPMLRVSTAAEEIDIQPDVAVSPIGTTFVTWVNDPLHVDMIESNQGRRILYSSYLGDQSWSAPQPVIADPSPFPGLLDPDLALGKGGTGMLVFTALPPNIEESDPGLGSTRLLFAVPLSIADLGPTWGIPELVGEKCDTPIFAHAPQVLTIPADAEIHQKFALLFQERGPIGSRAGAGNIRAASYSTGVGRWTEPINMTPDERVHQGVTGILTAGGEIVTIHQSPYPALRSGVFGSDTSRGGGGDLAPQGEVPGATLFADLMGQSVPCAPDPAIVSCRLSDDSAGPGSRLEGKIGVGNRGFVAIPDADSLTLTVSIGEGTDRQVVERFVVPALEPGEEWEVEVEFTMPREPAAFMAEVEGIEGEWNPADNRWICPIGAQKPEDLTCRLIPRQGRKAVLLDWTPRGIYERVQIYRNGSLLTEVAGSETSFVDAAADIVSRGERIVEHEYRVRGLSGLSRSIRSKPCRMVIEVRPSDPGGSRFIRSDSNADGKVDISDGVFTLTHLFLGGTAPPCREAANANGDLGVDISDAIYTLTYLFLGGEPPPAPFPSCGASPDPGVLGCAEFAPCAP